MKSIYTILFLCLCLTGCTPRVTCPPPPKLSSITLIDNDGMTETISNAERLKRYSNIDFLCPQQYQKVLRVFTRNDCGDVPACITSYHPNGQIKNYLEVYNGRAFGYFREWHSNGTLKVEALVIGGEADLTKAAKKTWLFDGTSKVWDDECTLLAEVPYSKGELQGISLSYHKNGNIWKSTPFNKNAPHGVCEIYKENGELLQSINYINGKREGPSYRYWDCENLASDEVYVCDKLMAGRYYDRKGGLLSQIDNGTGFRTVFSKDGIAELQEYRGGVIEGEIRIYGRGMRIAKTYQLKNGLKNGEEIHYFEKSGPGGKLLPKLSLSWKDSKIQGPAKSWYDTGVQESYREMSNNKKNGVSRAWYKDGTLMLIEEYDQDKLVRGEYFKKGDKSPTTKVVYGRGIASLFDGDGHFLHKITYQNGFPSE